MGIFDEQIKQRIMQDDAAFSEAFAEMADVVMGEKLSEKLYEDHVKTKNAIDEILKYYHVKPQELPDNIKDTVDQLEFLMRPAGIMWRNVCLEGRWYRDAAGAMLGTRKDDGSVVALIPGKISGYDFYDIKSGKRSRLNEKTAALLDEEALCFYKPFPLRELTFKDLIFYMWNTIRMSDWIAIVFGAFAAVLVGLLIPYINNIIYSDVIGYGSLQMLLSVFTFLLCITISQAMFEVFKALAISRLTLKSEVAFHAAGMSRLLSLPASFFKKYSAGDLANRMEYMGTICTTVISTVVTTGITALFSLIYIGQMVHYGPGLVVPGMAVIVLTVLVTAVNIAIQIHYTNKIMKAETKESGLAYELISGLQKIKIAGAEKRAFAKWARMYTQVARASYDRPAIVHVSKVATVCISLVGTLAIYFFAIKTGVSLADYFAFQAAYGMVVGAFTMLIGVAETLAQIKPVMELFEPIMKTVPETAVTKSAVTRLTGNIELSNVTFRYEEGMPNVIDGVSFAVKTGEYVAIVGKTGCGKSTLMRLLLGLETPQRGAVYYDNKSLATLDLKSVRRKIGTVIQDGTLFQGDVFSNITIGAPWMSIDDAWEAAELAGIAEDIRNMPMGMHTLIAEGGAGISGGQKQRLMIARAIAPKPKILMFDEATSALDNVAQKMVSDSLDTLKCTRIVIAHRLSTIKNCDRILVLDKGKIVEDGSYDELIKKDGVFAELVKRQQ